MLFCLITAGIDLSVGATCHLLCLPYGYAGSRRGYKLFNFDYRRTCSRNRDRPYQRYFTDTSASAAPFCLNTWYEKLSLGHSTPCHGISDDPEDSPKGVMALGSATVGGFPVKSFIGVVILYIVLHIVFDTCCIRAFCILCRREYGGHTSLRYQLSKCADSLLCAFRALWLHLRELSPLDVPVSVTVRNAIIHIRYRCHLPPVYSAEHLSWSGKVR